MKPITGLVSLAILTANLAADERKQPTLPDDLDVLSRPVTYVTWDVRAIDGKEHQITIWFRASADLVRNQPGQKVQASSSKSKQGDRYFKIGTEEQPFLQKKGDNLRI